MKQKTLVAILMISILYFMPLLVSAQPDPGGDPDVPIDGGLSLLVAAGVSYVAKKGYDKRKKQLASTDQIEK